MIPLRRRQVVQRGLAVTALLPALVASLMRPAQAAVEAATDWDAAFDAGSLASALQALTVQPVEAPDLVQLKVQDLAENGAAVPVSFGTTWAEARWLLLAVERNPQVLSAAFELQPAWMLPQFNLRVKMAASSPVLVLALDGRGQARYARHEVTVIQGSCTA